MFYFYKSFWSVLLSQALETPQLGFHELNGRKSCWTWPGSAPKPPRLSPEPSPEPCWTWPGSAPKPPGTFYGTFSGTVSGTLLNLTWLCTKASETFTGTFSGTLLNLTWLCTEASQTFSGTFSRTFAGTLLNLTWLCTKASWNLLWNLFRNPVEPHQRLPDLLCNLFWNPVERGLALHQSPDLLRNLRNLLRNLVEPDPAPAPVHTGAFLGWRPH